MVETQTMSDTVDSCPVVKLDSNLSQTYSADDDAIQWLENLGR